jgi:hypothetical protein
MHEAGPRCVAHARLEGGAENAVATVVGSWGDGGNGGSYAAAQEHECEGGDFDHFINTLMQ